MPKHYSTNDSWVKRHPKHVAIMGIVAMAVVTILLILNFAPKPEPETSSTSTDCEYWKTLTSEDSSFGEPSAGTYEYVLYTTSKGIEVWKCVTE